DGRLQLLEGVHDAFQRAVVVDPRHLELLFVIPTELVRSVRQSQLNGRVPLIQALRRRGWWGCDRRRTIRGDLLAFDAGQVLRQPQVGKLGAVREGAVWVA